MTESGAGQERAAQPHPRPALEHPVAGGLSRVGPQGQAAVGKQAAGEGRQPAGVGDEKKGAVRKLVNAGGRSRRRRGSCVAHLRLDEHDGLAAYDAVSAAGERENGGDDNEVELANYISDVQGKKYRNSF